MLKNIAKKTKLSTHAWGVSRLEGNQARPLESLPVMYRVYSFQEEFD